VPGYLSQYSDLLWAGWAGDQILVGVTFFAPDQTSHGAHPASYTMGTGSFLGVKRLGHCFIHTSQSCVEVKRRVEQYLNSSSVPSWQVIV